MYHIKEDIKEIVKELPSEFTAKLVKEKVLQKWRYCSQGWVSECLKDLGYAYNKSGKYWYKKPIIVDNIALSAHNNIVNEFKNKLEKIENKIGSIITGLLNQDYCSKCKKKILCRYYTQSVLSPCKICIGHKNLIEEIVDLAKLIDSEGEKYEYIQYGSR